MIGLVVVIILLVAILIRDAVKVRDNQYPWPQQISIRPEPLMMFDPLMFELLEEQLRQRENAKQRERDECPTEESIKP